MKTLAKIFASGFGSGYAPIAPGTAGSILATLIVFGLHDLAHVGTHFMTIFLIAASVFGTVVGIISCNILEDEWGKDPSKVVLDEMVGIFISLIWVPINMTSIILSLILFRIFDISKMLGIKKLESIEGGTGVMADDILAGIYANFILQLLVYFAII